MLRLVVLIALVVAVWLLLEWTYRKALAALGIERRGRRNGGRVGPRAARGERPAEALVRCGACGTYVPASRAFPAPGGGGAACSEACRAALRHGA